MTRPRDSYEFVDVHTDIPDGMTIREWRAQRAVEREAQRRQERAARRERVSALLTAPRLAAAKLCQVGRLVVARDRYPRLGIRSHRRTAG